MEPFKISLRKFESSAKKGTHHEVPFFAYLFWIAARLRMV